MPLTPVLPPMALPTGLEAATMEHALKMKVRSLKVQVCKLKTKLREVNQLKITRKACVNKESMIKHLKKLLPAKAYTFAMETTKPVDKICAIITDEISLKQAVHYNEPADRIEGFEDFGRGQRTMPLHSCGRNSSDITSGPIPHTRLQSLLLEAIRELKAAGMECLVFVCDQGSGNCSMLTRLGVTKEKAYFEVDAVRVFCLWDPPHLIKNIRNNWRSSGFMLDGDRIFWAILEELYTYVSKQDSRLCCCLTKKHVHLPPFASMRVRFAAQVLSHSVAVGIKTLAQVKQLTGQAQRNYMAAAKFCENFDGIFNCVEGWQHNIVCLKMIWCVLRERHQVPYLLTNRLNQDCLENAYSAIRGM
ncbi:hypothetical protein M9458_057837 [Cirrhinus mrigala]|uniref:Transposable element P transposase n=1 Tax=Cirrhinus mrigala TaxID=683832 RepID=A0ABD0MF50_CIRMR